MSSKWFDTVEIVTAWDILLQNIVASLPIVPTKIASHHNIHVKTYFDYEHLTKIKYFSLCEKISEDAFTQFVDGEYFIFYNPHQYPYRMRWSLMHELSHIFLGHIHEGQPFIARSPIRDPLEKEADHLTAHILCPDIVVKQCGVESPEELRKLIYLSREATENQWNRISASSGHPISAKERQVLIQFQPFIARYREQKSYDFDRWNITIPKIRSRYVREI